MEKDVDEVGKVALFVKSKIEELDREVEPFAACITVVVISWGVIWLPFLWFQNLTNRQKPGCGKGTGVDRSRTSTTL